MLFIFWHLHSLVVGIHTLNTDREALIDIWLNQSFLTWYTRPSLIWSSCLLFQPLLFPLDPSNHIRVFVACITSSIFSSVFACVPSSWNGLAFPYIQLIISYKKSSSTPSFFLMRGGASYNRCSSLHLTTLFHK